MRLVINSIELLSIIAIILCIAVWADYLGVIR